MAGRIQPGPHWFLAAVAHGSQPPERTDEGTDLSGAALWKEAAASPPGHAEHVRFCRGSMITWGEDQSLEMHRSEFGSWICHFLAHRP